MKKVLLPGEDESKLWRSVTKNLFLPGQKEQLEFTLEARGEGIVKMSSILTEKEEN